MHMLSCKDLPYLAVFTLRQWFIPSVNKQTSTDGFNSSITVRTAHQDFMATANSNT